MHGDPRLRGDDESVAGTTCSCRQGEAPPPPLSVQVGGGRGCFPEHFPEEGVAREPVSDFEDVPVDEFYQDAVAFQVERGAQGQRKFALVYLVLPCDGRDVEHGGELVPLFPGDFRVVEQPALFSVLFDLVEVVVEGVPEAVVRGEVAVAALVRLLV